MMKKIVASLLVIGSFNAFAGDILKTKDKVNWKTSSVSIATHGKDTYMVIGGEVAKALYDGMTSPRKEKKFPVDDGVTFVAKQGLEFYCQKEKRWVEGDGVDERDYWQTNTDVYACYKKLANVRTGNFQPHKLLNSWNS